MAPWPRGRVSADILCGCGRLVPFIGGRYLVCVCKRGDGTEKAINHALDGLPIAKAAPCPGDMEVPERAVD